ncbi:MAG: PIN domain-containing protein [Solirubrobacterales bacterium]|nr:PIN domain-containing protein [Solirubrobacterales bacterium]
MGSVLLDTGVVIGVLDPDDVHHVAAMKAVGPYRESGASFKLSTISLAELLMDRRSRRRDDVFGFIELLGEHALVPVDASVADVAGELRSRRRSLRLPDALIAATAVVEKAEVLLTTDKALARLEGAKLVGAARR